MPKVPYPFPFIAAVLGAVVCHLLSACTTTDVEQYVDGGRVVGKSSYVRPFWIDKPLYMNEARTLAYMTYKKKNVHILELGLKQAQTEALLQAGKQFDRQFAQFVSGLVERSQNGAQSKKQKKAEPVSPDLMAKLQSLCLEVSKSFDEPVVKSEAVYWEELEKFESESSGGMASQELVREYQISVLVSLESSEITDRLSAVLAKLGSGAGNAPLVSALEGSFEGLKAARKETDLEKKEVEAINTEMDSSGAEIESSQDAQGPKGRKVPQVITPSQKNSDDSNTGMQELDTQQLQDGVDSNEQ